MEKSADLGKTNDVKISIVTACYKSESFLERVYQSIKEQDYKNIEWIAVDDLSPDKTLDKLAELKARNEFPVTILALPENTRAFGAIREGIALATGKFTLILDHDDELMPNALSTLMRSWNSLAPADERLYGIWGRCVDENNKVMGNLYKQAPLVCGNGYFFHVLKCRDECFVMVDTELLKKYYVLTGEEIIKTNGSIWNEIGKKYRCIFTNEVIRRYHTNVPNSQSKHRKPQYPLSQYLQEAEYLADNNYFFRKDPSYFLKSILIYLKFGYYANISISSAVKNLKYRKLKVAAVMLIPLLPLLILKDRLF